MKRGVSGGRGGFGAGLPAVALPACQYSSSWLLLRQLPWDDLYQLKPNLLLLRLPFVAGSKASVVQQGELFNPSCPIIPHRVCTPNSPPNPRKNTAGFISRVGNARAVGLAAGFVTHAARPQQLLPSWEGTAQQLGVRGAFLTKDASGGTSLCWAGDLSPAA